MTREEQNRRWLVRNGYMYDAELWESEYKKIISNMKNRRRM